MGSLKRPEENYKFIFKKTLKIMKENFREISKKKRIRKQDLENEFYLHYFRGVSQKMSG
jgi:hypothetical protein